MTTVRKFKSVTTLIAFLALGMNGFAQETKTVMQVFRNGTIVFESPITSIDHLSFDQGASNNALILQKKNGTVNIPLNEIQRLTFLSGDYLLIKRNVSDEVHAFNEIKKLLFEKAIVPPPPTTFAVTVINGAANKSEYAAGSIVTITASPPPAGYKFKNWTSLSIPSVIFANPYSESTFFTMPSSPVFVMSNHEESLNTGNINVSSSKALLKTWMQNDILYVSGVNAGDVLSVFNLLGSLIDQKIANNEESSLSLKNCDTGFYILRVQSAHGSVVVQKFLKH